LYNFIKSINIRFKLWKNELTVIISELKESGISTTIKIRN